MSVGTGRWLLDRQPTGAINESFFRWDVAELAPLVDGQLLVRHIYLSLDPGNRIWMSDRDWLRELDPKLRPILPGETLKGATISIVEESLAEGFAPGDVVQPALSEWAERQVVEAATTTRIDVEPGIPLHTYLGTLGHTGLTAYMGVVEVAQLRSGETLLVDGASGAVGLAAGEIARQLGATTIGLTGGPDKVRALEALGGFDHVLDARDDKLGAALRAIRPTGVDALFENVGGRLLDVCLSALKDHGRIAVCGLADAYDAANPPSGPSPFPAILMRRLRVQGFGVFDFSPELHQKARAALADWYRRGLISHRVDLTTGLAEAPCAFVRLLSGTRAGKAVVRIEA